MLDFLLDIPNILQIYQIFCKNGILGYPPNSPNFQVFGFGRIFCWNVLQNIMPKQGFGRTLLTGKKIYLGSGNLCTMALGVFGVNPCTAMQLLNGWTAWWNSSPWHSRSNIKATKYQRSTTSMTIDRQVRHCLSHKVTNGMVLRAFKLMQHSSSPATGVLHGKSPHYFYIGDNVL